MEGPEFREMCGLLKEIPDPNNPNLMKDTLGDMQKFKEV